MSKQFMLNQLNTLPPERKLELHDTHALCTCPIHANGKERTPSLKINLDFKGNFKPGSARCFACGQTCKTWDELAAILGLKKQRNADVAFDFGMAQRSQDRLLDAADEITDFSHNRKLPPEIKFAPLWPKDKIWRGISGRLLHNIKARELQTEYGSKLYLPSFINKKFYGGVTAALVKSKRFPSYINDAGPWIKQVVFPHDYVKHLLSNQSKRILFLGEGPRDSLNPLQYGIPTLAMLGGKTVWSQEKIDLILNLEADLIVFAFDCDEVGEALTELAEKALHTQVKCIKMKFPVRTSEYKMDAGDTPKKRWLRIKERLGIT